MANSYWSGARIGQMNDSPSGGLYLAELLAELEPGTIPSFPNVAARDTALSSWVAAGNTKRAGQLCYTASEQSLWIYTGSSWDVIGLLRGNANARPGVFYGSLSAFPAGAQYGDTVYRTDLMCLLTYTAGGWQQVGSAVYANAGVRQSLAMAGVMGGFQGIDGDSAQTFYWDGTSWYSTNWASQWRVAAASDTGYLWAPAVGGPQALPGMSTVVRNVRAGQELEVMFSAGIGRCNDGFMHVRLYFDGVHMDAVTLGGPGLWAPIRLHGSAIYTTNRDVAIGVTGEMQSGDGDIRTTPGGIVLLKFRIN